jgi:hypothetical protein
MIVREMRVSRALIALLVGAVVISMTGCPNLSQDLDLKAQIQGDVLEANAEQVAIRVQPESEAMGVTSPSGPSTAKVGVAFPISTTVSPEYAFLSWEQGGGDGEVAFADAANPETEVTITKKGTGIVIVARFDARPAVIIKDPDGGEGILRNRKIFITFSEPVDPSSVNFETISVEERPKSIPGQPLVSIVDRLTLSVDQAVVMISPKVGMSYDIQNYVWIKVTKSVKDLAGNMMKENFSWYFITGNDSDIVDPVLNSFTIKDGATVLPADGRTKSRLGVTLETDAYDNDMLDMIRVTETALTDITGAPITGTPEVTHFGYEIALSYGLRTVGDGRKEITVQVIDGVGNESADIRSSTIILDTTGPVATSFSAICGAWTNLSTIPILHAVSDGGILGCPDTSIQVSFRVGGGAWQGWQAFSATQSVPISGDGAIAISAKYRDELGNETSAASIAANSTVTINRDALAPVISSFQIDHGTYPGYTTVQGIAVSFAAADTGGSGVSGFEVTESATPSGSWTPWTGGTVGSSAFMIDAAEGTHTVRVHVRDLAGNVGTASDLVILDHTEPAVEVTASGHPDATVKNGDVVSLTATFTEANRLSSAPAITIAGTTVNAASMSGGGLVWTYAWTVSEGAGMDADVAVSVDAVDMVGLHNTATTGATTFRIDNVAPAAPGTPSYPSGPWINRAVNDAGFALTVLLPAGAKADDTLQLLRNGTPWKSVTLVQADVDANSRTVSIGARELGANGGSEDGDKLISARLIDAAGNGGPVSSSELLLRLETTLPGVSLAASGHPDATVKNGDVVSFTATFTEAVVATPALTIVGGGAVTNTGGSGTTWTYSWTVSAVTDMDADTTVAVSAADAAGNPNSAATGATSFHIDNVKPVISSVTLSDEPIKNEIATVVFSEPVFANANATGALVGSSEVGASDLAVTDASAVADITAWAINPAHSAGSGTLTINLTWSSTPTRDVDTVTVAAANATSVYDAAGNAMPGGSGATGTAKRLSIEVPSATGGAAAARPASIASGSRGIQPLAIVDQVPERPQLKQAPPRATPSAAPRQATTGVEPLAQFHRPIVLPDKPDAEIRAARAPSVPAVTEATDRGTPVQIARGTSAEAPAAVPAVRRSEARIALPDADAVLGLAEPSPEKRGASSIPVVGIFIFGAVLLLVCGWFGALLLRRAASRR